MKRTHAFTLVELLVVIGIIALLISILLPSLAKARRSAEAVSCASNMKQIGLGFQMYVDANHGWMPSAGEDGDPGAPITGPDNRGWASEGLWFNAVNRYVVNKTYDQMQLDAANKPGAKLPNAGDHHVMICPAASPAGGVANGPDSDETTGDGYFLMHGYENDASGGLGANVARKSFVCYAMNYKLFNTNVSAGRMSHLRPGSAVVLVYEKRTISGEATAADDAYYAAMGGGTGKILTAPLGRFRGDWKRLTTRHNKGGNLLYADGHVSPVTFRDAMTPAVVGVNDWNRPDRIWDVAGPATK